MPGLKRAILVELIEAGIAGRGVAKQDIGEAVPVEIAGTHRRVGGRGAADGMPACQDAIADRVKTRITRVIVAEQNVAAQIGVKIIRRRPLEHSITNPSGGGSLIGSGKMERGEKRIQK